MNFERKNIDPYETLRVGERANALEFKTIHIIVINEYMERNLDGINRKKQGQTIVLLKKHQMDQIMRDLQLGILTKDLILKVLALGEAPDHPIFVSNPIFYINENCTYPSAKTMNIGDPNVPHFIKEIVNRWIIVNGNFYRLPQILADLYPKGERGYGWEV